MLCIYTHCSYASLSPFPSSYSTAQSRSRKTSPSGFCFHRCLIKPFSQDQVGKGSVFLGRPWRPYARVVFARCYMEDVVNAEGWVAWDGEGKDLPDTVFYAEFENEGKGAVEKGGVLRWKGVHWLAREDVDRFSVSRFIQGTLWIPITGVSFDAEIG